MLIAEDNTSLANYRLQFGKSIPKQHFQIYHRFQLKPNRQQCHARLLNKDWKYHDFCNECVECVAKLECEFCHRIVPRLQTTRTYTLFEYQDEDDLKIKCMDCVKRYHEMPTTLEAIFELVDHFERGIFKDVLPW